MKKSFFFFPTVGLLAALLPSFGFCSSEITVRVLSVGTYSNGNLYLALDGTINEPGCSLPYIELLANSPALKAVMATATFALANNSTVVIKTDSCVNGVPSLSGSRTGYFIANKP